MTRELYLELRRRNDAVLLYEYYKEKFDAKKHHPFLSHTEFFTYLPLWGDMNEIFQKITSALDEEFKVMKLTDPEGKIINYI